MLYLLSNRYGFFPFASFIRDPDIYEKFSEVVLIKITREKNELIYVKDLVSSLQQDPLIVGHMHNS